MRRRDHWRSRLQGSRSLSRTLSLSSSSFSFFSWLKAASVCSSSFLMEYKMDPAIGHGARELFYRNTHRLHCIKKRTKKRERSHRNLTRSLTFFFRDRDARIQPASVKEELLSLFTREEFRDRAAAKSSSAEKRAKRFFEENEHFGARDAILRNSQRTNEGKNVESEYF